MLPGCLVPICSCSLKKVFLKRHSCRKYLNRPYFESKELVKEIYMSTFLDICAWPNLFSLLVNNLKISSKMTRIKMIHLTVCLLHVETPASLPTSHGTTRFLKHFPHYSSMFLSLPSSTLIFPYWRQRARLYSLCMLSS